MSQPTLSVVIPNYNHGHLIERSLEAICSQSFQPIEIIVVDDASTDNSLDVIENMMREYPLIQLVQNEKNMGHLYSEKKSIDLTKGSHYIAWAADDEVLPGFFEKSMNLLARYPEAGLCSGISISEDEHGNKIGAEPPIISKLPCYLSPDEALKAFLERGFWFSSVVTIWRKQAVTELGAYSLEAAPFTDLFAAYLLALNYGVCFVPEPMGTQFVGPNRFSSEFTTDPNMYLELSDPMLKLMRGKYSDKFPKEFVEDLERKELYTYSTIVLDQLNSSQDECLEYIKRALEKPTALDHVFLSINRVVAQIQKYLAKIYMFFRLRRINLHLLLRYLYRITNYILDRRKL